jgi:hypothetical protein
MGNIPNGWLEWVDVAVYRKENRLVILGIPDEGHNCDYMGCGSVGPHVIAHATLENHNTEMESQDDD